MLKLVKDAEADEQKAPERADGSRSTVAELPGARRRPPILTPVSIRQAELPRSFRGFDENATRDLLARIADTFHALTGERDELKRRASELEQAAAAREAVPEPAEKVSNALLSATRVAEELLTDAHAEAERVRAEAKDEAARLLDASLQEAQELERAAREEADRLVAAARERVDDLEEAAARLRSAIAATYERFAEVTSGALADLGSLGADAGAPRPKAPG